MKPFQCPSCGSKELDERSGYMICAYCRSKFIPQAEDRPPLESVIGVKSDIDKLIEKCRTDPSNRRKYANLILDIDPTNHEALKYL